LVSLKPSVFLKLRFVRHRRFGLLIISWQALYPLAPAIRQFRARRGLKFLEKEGFTL